MKFPVDLTKTSNSVFGKYSYYMALELTRFGIYSTYQRIQK